MPTVLHSSLTGTDLHEPKGVSSASSGQVYVANGGGSGAWTTLTTPVFMNKHIAGLILSNAVGDPTNDVVITAGTCRDSTNTEDMTLGSSLTKRLDAAWTVGDNQGGLDTGAIANTTYHMWLIKRTDTGVVDALFSTSATAPTMPTNYTKKRRIGSFVRAAAAIQTFSALELSGGGMEMVITPSETSGLSFGVTGTNNTITNFPTGVKMEASVAFFKAGATGNLRVMVVSPDQTLPSMSGSLSGSMNTETLFSAGSGDSTLTVDIGGHARVRTNTSAQVKCGASAATTGLVLTNFGWKDYRID